MAVYVQVYLFIILYSYWIATNIIQYLLYLVVLVQEYMSLFTQLYLRKWTQLLYQRIMQPLFRNTRIFHGGGRYSHTQAWLEGSAVMAPIFCDCRSYLVPIVWYNQIDTLFLQKNSVCVYHIQFQRYMDIKLI